QLNLQEKVVFLGFVDPEELKKLTRKSYIGYNLLENLGQSYYYSLSNKFFDYIHAAIPSLSPPFPEYQQINSAFEVSVLTNLSEENIVIQVNRLLNDRQFYEYLQENCLNAKRVFNWQREEEKLRIIYNDL